MAERVPIGKRMVGVRSVFSVLHSLQVRRPLSPVCALGTSPKRGSALRGEVGTVPKSARKTELTCHCEERGTSDVAIRIPIRRTKTTDSPKENGFPRRASPSSE